MRILFLVAALGLSIGGGCSSDPDEDPTGEPPDVFVFTLNDECRAPLRNGLAAEDTCTLPDDCAEVCCDCQASTRSFSAQACVAGKCSTKDSTCAHAEQVTEICNP